MAKYLKTEQGYIDASIFAPAQFKPEGKSYLTFSSPKNFTLKVNNATKNWDGTLEYFSADKAWAVWDGTTILSAYNNDGEYVLYLRGTGNTKITGLPANGSNDTYRWVLTGSDIACVGNIENLLDYATVESGQHPTMADYCYPFMFYDCTALTQAPSLPATTLADYCYCGMFVRCTSLTQAPVLPAITLSKGCYQDMFFGCTSLTQAPTLTATTLADYCYADMFYGCTSLTQAPALSATTLSSHCYCQMFSNCTSLTQTPALPATTLANDCYYYMFHDCTSLTKAPALPATTLAKNCYTGMFSGCTSLTQAPALPATTLANNCYDRMFRGCTALTQAPALPATTLANNCYYRMFQNCTSLKLSNTKTGEYTQEYRIPSSGTGTTATDALIGMFVSTGGTFTGTPAINTTYYLSTDNMIVRENEVATLNGYVGSMIDKYNGMTPVECVFPPQFDGGSETSKTLYVKQGVINPVDYKTVTDDIKTAWLNLTFLTDVTNRNLSSYRNTIKCIAPLIEIGVFGEDFFNTVTWDSSCVFFDDPITQSKKITIWTSSASTKSFGVIVDGPNGYYASDSYSILNDEFNGNGIVYDQHLRPYSNNANDTNSKLGQLEMEAAPTKDMQIATKKYVDDAIGKYANTAEYIIPSSTSGSTKKFKITVDDSGTLTATEVT